MASAFSSCSSVIVPSRHKVDMRASHISILHEISISKRTSIVILACAARGENSRGTYNILPTEKKRAPSDLKALFRRFSKVAAPYWSSEDKVQARVRLLLVLALSLATTGMRVGFSFLGRSFDNALINKNQQEFFKQLFYYFGASILVLPVYVLKQYMKDLLALRWRSWMTNHYLNRYFDKKAYYNIQSQSLMDNPDQRLVDDIQSFTSTALSFSLTLFTAIVDLISFSSILFSIYPPLFAVLVIYSVGGTAVSVWLGKDLVNLNFMQEKSEADVRYGLVRVRENAESIAFYSGESNEVHLLLQRFRQAFDNYKQLLLVSRNLQYFQVLYNNLIRILPAAIVAPLYFAGKIDYGVISQAFYAFNNILYDLSLVIDRFQSLSSFSAVIDRLGEFSDALDQETADQSTQIKIVDITDGDTLLKVESLTLLTPQCTLTFLEDLSFRIIAGQNLLVMGANGSGKTSLLRAIAGLWKSGEGTITRCLTTGACNSIFFLPQKPYMVLGTLRQQLLYPSWGIDTSENHLVSRNESEREPTDDNLVNVIHQVKLEQLLNRGINLDTYADWASVLSLGEQQRLAFARLLLSKPRLALLDEATSALDEETETYLYRQLKNSARHLCDLFIFSGMNIVKPTTSIFLGWFGLFQIHTLTIYVNYNEVGATIAKSPPPSPV